MCKNILLYLCKLKLKKYRNIYYNNVQNKKNPTYPRMDNKNKR